MHVYIVSRARSPIYYCALLSGILVCRMRYFVGYYTLWDTTTPCKHYALHSGIL
jgi:hypothetical protein